MLIKRQLQFCTILTVIYLSDFLFPDIVESVRRPSQAGKSPLRPMVDEDCGDEEIIKLMSKCWSEDPLDRPDFSALKVAIRKLNK